MRFELTLVSRLRLEWVRILSTHPSTSSVSPSTLTTEAVSVASVGERESLEPKHEACADMSTKAAGKDKARTAHAEVEGMGPISEEAWGISDSGEMVTHF